MPIVSFLIGSGFSIPEGLPTVNDINNRMSKISQEEILIHSSMHAIFLNGQTDVNPGLRWDERLFVQKFLEYYNSEILASGEKFHYEKFYDFYSLYLSDVKSNKAILEKYCTEFDNEYVGGRSTFDAYNRISYFNRTFNQLLAQLLHRIKYVGEVTSFGETNYQGLVGFLRTLIKTHDIKIHSLNHDLFFEWLMKFDSGLSEHFSDGFEYDGSPFYGILRTKKRMESFDFQKNYRVKLSQFTNRFDNKLCLYKLHGSINTYIVHTDGNELSRIHWEYDIDEIYKEKSDELSGKTTTVGALEQVDPDFLTGIDYKVLRYQTDPFYTNLFSHFESNLKSSDIVIVIGYGFADPGINDYLERFYLKEGKKMIVIDPLKPTSPLFHKYEIAHISAGVTDLNSEEYLRILN